jgi:uncharacterized HAD superfamily protein
VAVIGIDIDGVLCSEERTFERPLAIVQAGAKDFLITLRKRGDVIILWTGRGWEQYKVTVDWLERNELPFDQLIMGKPIFDFFIDDRAIRHVDWGRTLSEPTVTKHLSS